MAQGSSNPTSNLTKINGTAVSVNSGVKDAGTQRVILASDQTAIPITDNAGSITVDGTFWQATQPVSIAASVAVTGPLTNTQLRASAVPVSLASVPSHAVTNAGTFAVQVDGSALTALQLIDDTVIADNTAIGATKLLAVGGTDGTNSQMLSVNTSGHVNIADGGNSITVDGTFWQATQPVSIATMPSTPVTGTFWQATQPVSIASTVNISGSVTLGSTPLVDISSFPTSSNTGTISTLNGSIFLSISPNNGGVSVNITAISAPTGITIIPEITLDNSTWISTYFFNPQTTAVTVNFTNAELTVGALRSIVIPSSVLAVRLRASTWTSGSVTFNLLNSDHADSSSILSTSAINSTARPPAAVQVAGWDGTTLRGLATNTSGHVNIADGGNSITVDGTVGISGTVPVSIATMPSTPVTGTFWQATQPVSIATSVPITDNSGSITVDAPVGTPAFVRLSDGTAAISTLPVSIAASVAVTGPLTDTQLRAAAVPVSLASVPSHAVTNAGTFAVQASQSGTWTVQPGNTANTTPWLTRPSDGTNSAAIKAASTAAIAADPALVVAISPNNTITTKGQSLTNNSTTAYATSLIIKASAGSLYIITGFNSKTTDQFIQLHDSSTLPADTSVPKVIFRVAANSNFSFDLGVYGRVFTNGIVVCNSSTGPTKTIGAADCWFDCQYI